MLQKKLSLKDLEEYAELVDKGVLVPVWLHGVNRRETLLECFIRWKNDQDLKDKNKLTTYINK